MNNTTITTAKARQVSKFKTPLRIEQEKDRFGCVGFISYGFIQWDDGRIEHIKNPDFNWKKVRRA